MDINAKEDSSLGATIYQGKTLAQWEKDFDGEFTVRQLFQLIRSGVDLGRIKIGLVDEAKDIDDKQLFKGEEFFFKEDEDVDEEIRTVTDLVDALNDATKAPNSTDVIVKDLNGHPLWISNVVANRRAVLLETKNIVGESKKEETMSKDFSKVNVNESARQPEDVVTVDDLVSVLRRNGNPNDKVMFRIDKKECMLFDINSKGGTTVVDIVKGKPMSEAYDKTHEEKWEEMATWFNGHGYEIEDDEDRLDQIAPQGDSILFKKGKRPDGKDADKSMSFDDAWEIYQSLKNGQLNEDVELETTGLSEDFITPNDLERIGQDAYKHNKDGWKDDNIAAIVNGKVVDCNIVKYIRPEGYPSNGTFFLLDGTKASLDAYENEKKIMLSEKEDKQMNEGRGWYGGGYGGTGRSYASFKGHAPRGKQIDWYTVEELDPKMKGKMPGWRGGPANFPFIDALYPNRKYKRGAMMIRNKYVQAGASSGVVEIGIASIFDAIKNNDEKALETLRLLKIPLDLTLGMDPKEDYSNNYDIISR